MTSAQITAGSDTAAKNDIITYTISISSDTPVNSAVIDIIPSVEEYPKMCIAPDSATVTADNGALAQCISAPDGIFTIELSGDGTATDFSVSFNAVSNGFSGINTTAAMISTTHGTAAEEAYAQTSIREASHFPLAAIAAVLLSAALIVIFCKVFFHKQE